VECLKKIPCLDEKYHPQVTFLGPRDEWMQKAGKYKYLYEMDTEIAYDWLRVWLMQITQVSKTASLMGPRGAPTTCHNQHDTSRSYSFGQI
jgi:hypothetical protein